MIFTCSDGRYRQTQCLVIFKGKSPQYMNRCAASIWWLQVHRAQAASTTTLQRPAADAVMLAGAPTVSTVLIATSCCHTCWPKQDRSTTASSARSCLLLTLVLCYYTPTSPLTVISRFSGLMSLCTIPRLCRRCTPMSTCLRTPLITWGPDKHRRHKKLVRGS